MKRIAARRIRSQPATPALRFVEKRGPRGRGRCGATARCYQGDDEQPVSLGEGATPLIPLSNGAFVKDEAQNPTGSFKSRGMLVAFTVAKCSGVPALVAPSAGNSGGALAAMAGGPSPGTRSAVVDLGIAD